jgi:hypothetical protein
MIKLAIALSTFVLAFTLPVAYAVASKPGPKTIAGGLLKQMNSGRDGKITRRVTCDRALEVAKTFDCSLESVIRTHLQARVAVVDGGLRTTWQPIQG